MELDLEMIKVLSSWMVILEQGKIYYRRELLIWVS